MTSPRQELHRMENQAHMTNRIRLNLLAAALLLNQAAFAVHLDVEVWGEGNALFAGYCRTPGVVGCDLGGLTQMLELPAGALPKEAATGKLIFLADFRDLRGFPHQESGISIDSKCVVTQRTGGLSRTRGT